MERTRLKSYLLLTQIELRGRKRLNELEAKLRCLDKVKLSTMQTPKHIFKETLRPWYMRIGFVNL
jgi:hypothetical protein